MSMKQRQLKLATVSASKIHIFILFQLKFPALRLVIALNAFKQFEWVLGDRSDIIIILSIRLIDTQHPAAGHYEYVAEIRDVPHLECTRMRWHQLTEFDLAFWTTDVCLPTRPRTNNSKRIPLRGELLRISIGNSFKQIQYVVNCVISVAAGWPYYLEIWFHVSTMDSKMDVLSVGIG